MKEMYMKSEGVTQKQFLLDTLPKYIKNYIYGQIRKGKNGQMYPPLLHEQQEVLKDFYIYLTTENGNITKYYSYFNNIYMISIFGRYIQKPFNEVKKQDIMEFLFNLKTNGYKESTLNGYRIKLRHFFTFLYQTKEYPKVVSWIQLTKTEDKEISEDSLLTKMDIKNMTSTSTNSRDRAIVTVLYESACRRSELLSINLQHVINDKYGIRLKIPESKTKKRTVRLIDSVPYLQEWLNNHPYKEKVDSPLFISLDKGYGQRLQSQGLKYILMRLGRVADIKKKVNPHNFRHSRLNELAKDGFNERDLRLFAGWSEDSNMPKVYLHYGERELDEKMLKKSGIQTKEDTQEEIEENECLKSRECPRCKMECPSTSRYCYRCGMTLNLKEFMEDQEKLKIEEEKTIKLYGEIMCDPIKKKQFEEFKRLILST